MGQSLDCWEKGFLLANCFPQKYLLAAKTIVLTLFTITHFEMYLERGLGSLLAAFSYKVQTLVCNPTQHVKAFAAGPSPSLTLCSTRQGICIWIATVTTWGSIFLLTPSKRRGTILWSTTLFLIEKNLLACFCKHCDLSVSGERRYRDRREGTKPHGVPGSHVPMVLVEIAFCFSFCFA